MGTRVDGVADGGGASLPVADPADLLSGATPERFVVIDDAGDSAHVLMYLPVGAELSVRTPDGGGMSSEAAAANGSKNWLGAFRLL